MKPFRLMTERMDHSRATTAKSDGSYRPTYSILNNDVPCNIQPATSQVMATYRIEEQVDQSIFLISQSVFNAILPADRITIDDVHYEVKGKQNLAGRNRVFRVDVTSKLGRN